MKELEREAALLMTVRDATSIFDGDFDDEDRQESTTMADDLDAYVKQKIREGGADRKHMYAAISLLFVTTVVRSIL
jgi:hypothetical protein